MKIYKITFYILLGLLLCHCEMVEWESVDIEKESKLNVIGILSPDDDLPSFVYVSKILNTGAKEKELIRTETVIDTIYERTTDPFKDTIYVDSSSYHIDTSKVEIHESKFLVKDAKVKISDGENTYNFKPIRISSNYWKGDTLFNKYYNFPEEETIIYTDKSNQFKPEPNTEYYLTVEADSVGRVTGKVKTPEKISFINKSELNDTLNPDQSYTLKWNSTKMDNVQLKLDSGENVEMSKRDSTYRFVAKGHRETLIIRNMEDNYYEYFYDDESEGLSAVMIGRTITAKSCGVKGGFGVFGALDIDKIERVVNYKH